MRNPNARIPDPNEFVTDPGDPIHVIYSSKVMEDGTINLVPCGKEDIQEIIDSHAEETDMHYIMEQLAMGNVSVLNSKQPMYGDFSQAPQDMRHAMQIMIDGERAFYQLPVDIRQKFDNDFRKFIVSSGTPEWIAKMSPDSSPVSDSPSNPVNDKEVKE